MTADIASDLLPFRAEGQQLLHLLAVAVIACSIAFRLRAMASAPALTGALPLLRFAAPLNAALLLDVMLLLPPLEAVPVEAVLLLVAMLMGTALWVAALGMIAAPAQGGLGWLALPAPGLALALPLALLSAVVDAAPPPALGLSLLVCLCGGGLAALLLLRRRGLPSTVAAALLLLATVLAAQAMAGAAAVHGPRWGGPWPVAAVAGLATLLLRGTVGAWQQLRAVPARERALQGLPDLADASFEGIALLSRGRVVDANARLAQMTGMTPAALASQPLRALFPEADVAWLQRLQAGGFAEAVPGRLATAGALLEVEVIARRLGGAAQGRVALTIRDRSEALAAAHRIRHLSDHDPATGLPARGRFVTELTRHMEQLRRERQSARLLVLQVGALRSLQQVHGLQAEAAVLHEIATRLGAAVPMAAARLDGGSFGLLLPPGPGADAAGIVALQARMATPYAVGDSEVMLDIRIGVARCPEDGETAEELLALADIASERTGPGETIAFVQAARDQAARQQRALEQDLRFATALGQLRLHWQPQVAMDTGLLIGFEVLVRWQHPVHGMIPPDRFLPAAEASGVIQEIGSWVLRTAVAEAATWPVPLRVAVNVSPLQMLRAGFPEEVAQQLRDSGLPPARLELEITESTLIEDSARVRGAMDALRALGVQLAMDDFGTGYASIAMLRFFPFDTLKLDRSFLRDLESDGGARAILEAMMRLGTALGMAVLVEGVETPAQRDWLRAAGCGFGQGYLFGRPAPIEHWEGSELLLAPPPAASAEQPQGEPGQQQEGGEGQPAAGLALQAGAAPGAAPRQPHGHHPHQPGGQRHGQFRRAQQGQHGGELDVAAAQHAELPGRQQGEGRDQPAGQVLAFRPLPQEHGQAGEDEARQQHAVADAPGPQVLRDAGQRPDQLGARQQQPRKRRIRARIADAHAAPSLAAVASEAPGAAAGKAPARRHAALPRDNRPGPQTAFEMEQNPR